MMRRLISSFSNGRRLEKRPLGATVAANATSSCQSRWFQSLTASHRENLSELVQGSCLDGSQTDGNDTTSLLITYNTDWKHQYHGQSSLVLKPATVPQIAEIVRYCAQHSLPVVPQGGNTGLVGGSVPVHSEVILSLEKLNTIYRTNPISGLVACQAGVILQDLQTHAAEHSGLLVPLDLGAKGSCQIGGNLATNAGGQYYWRHGSLAANVVGLQVVTGQGEILNLNFHEQQQEEESPDDNATTTIHANRKDNTGYKLQQLFLGAEGTLGIITAVVLQCPALPVSRQAAWLTCPNFENVVQLVQRAPRALGEITAAVEWMDPACVRTVSHVYQDLTLPVEMELGGDSENGGSTNNLHHALLIETQGSHEGHDMEKLEAFLTDAMEEGLVVDGALAQDTKQFDHFWHIRESANPAIAHLGYGYKYDLSLNVTQFESFGKTMQAHLQQQLQDATGTNILCTNWGHVLDGNLHLNFTTPGQKTVNQDVLTALEPFVYEQIQQIGGSISAEHGIGQAKAQYLSQVHDRATLEMMRSVKRAFDPAGILNPYKVLPES